MVLICGSNLFSFFNAGTLKHGKSDAQSTEEAKDHKKYHIQADGLLSFDRSTNVSFSMTNHEESQPPFKAGG